MEASSLLLSPYLCGCVWIAGWSLSLAFVINKRMEGFPFQLQDGKFHWYPYHSPSPVQLLWRQKHFIVCLCLFSSHEQKLGFPGNSKQGCSLEFRIPHFIGVFVTGVLISTCFLLERNENGLDPVMLPEHWSMFYKFYVMRSLVKNRLHWRSQWSWRL